MTSQVFSINFVRHEFLPRQTRRALLYFFAGFIGLNLLITIGLAATAFHDQKSSSSLASLEGLKPEMESIRQRASKNLARLNAINAVRKERFQIADKLAGLAWTLPSRTWVSQIQSDRIQRTLTVEATSWRKADSPDPVSSKGWIETLQSDPDFMSTGLKRIEVVQSSQKQLNKIELGNFQFLAEWKET